MGTQASTLNQTIWRILGRSFTNFISFLTPFFIRNSKTEEDIPEDYLSEKFLERCLERRDGFQKGWVRQYRDSDPDSSAAKPKGWAVWGQKKVRKHYYFGRNYN